jgi:signal peptidase I
MTRRQRESADDRPVTLLMLLTLGALIVLGGVVYGSFLVVDSGDGFFSRNVSSSMTPTILDGDYLASRRIHVQRNGEPDVHRGDLVVHAWPPDPTKQFIKRLVGMPGDTLAMVEGKLILNGHAVAEPYAHHDEPTIDPVVDDFSWQRPFLLATIAADPSKYVPSRNNWGPIVVPRGQYFVLGDNRDHSLDSRYWGFVTGGELQGRIRRVYFSRDSTGRIRWSRIGERLQ